MKPGRLIAVVGPSGVGKDSVLNGLATAMPDAVLVRRVITRAPDLGGEAYQAVTPAEFHRLNAEGAFCLSWGAHDLMYGIPKPVQAAVQAGTDHLVNLSRTVLVDADRMTPRFVVINLTAEPSTLAARIAARGREDRASVEKRLARAVTDFDPRLTVHHVSNDGALNDTIDRALDVLARQEA